MNQNPKKQKSETLKQRDKARKDFLELKRMQQESKEGKSEEHVPYSGEIKPDTFGKKVEHFLFYYGKITIASIIAIVVVGFIAVSCFMRDDPDLTIVYYDAEILPDIYIEGIEEYFEKICSDYNGDGKVVVSIINCTYGAGKSTAQYQTQQQQKLQSLLAVDDESMLYVVGEMGYAYIMQSAKNLEAEGVVLPQSYYTECSLYEEMPLPDGMTMYLKKIKGTLMENDKEAKLHNKNAADFMQKLKEVE